MDSTSRKILILGASGLIGRFVTDDLRARGFRVVGVARSLSSAQTMSALERCEAAKLRARPITSTPRARRSSVT